MAEEKKEPAPEHEILKKVKVKQEHPWEKFKQTNNFRKNIKHGHKSFNRKTGV